jgi:hypothetical protein
MRVRVSVVSFLVLACSALLSGPSAIAGSSLDETYWESDDNCFIVDLFLHSNGDAEIEYDNDEADTGTWKLSGSRLGIEFDSYADDFTATVDGDAIKATHKWHDEKDRVQTESCTFTFVDTSI